MPESMVPVVLVGRFSTFAGQSVFATLAVNVVAYETAMINVWRGRLGGTTMFLFALEESNDQTVWTTLISGDPGQETEVLMAAALTKSWLRAKVVLADPAAVPVATCYAVGDLGLRKSAAEPVLERESRRAQAVAAGPQPSPAEIRPPGSLIAPQEAPARYAPE